MLSINYKLLTVNCSSGIWLLLIFHSCGYRLLARLPMFFSQPIGDVYKRQLVCRQLNAKGKVLATTTIDSSFCKVELVKKAAKLQIEGLSLIHIFGVRSFAIFFDDISG